MFVPLTLVIFASALVLDLVSVYSKTILSFKTKSLPISFLKSIDYEAQTSLASDAAASVS